ERFFVVAQHISELADDFPALWGGNIAPMCIGFGGCLNNAVEFPARRSAHVADGLAVNGRPGSDVFTGTEKFQTGGSSFVVVVQAEGFQYVFHETDLFGFSGAPNLTHLDGF